MFMQELCPYIRMVQSSSWAPLGAMPIYIRPRGLQNINLIINHPNPNFVGRIERYQWNHLGHAKYKPHQIIPTPLLWPSSLLIWNRSVLFLFFFVCLNFNPIVNNVWKSFKFVLVNLWGRICEGRKLGIGGSNGYKNKANHMVFVLPVLTWTFC